jgi:hypothetical protein
MHTKCHPQNLKEDNLRPNVGIKMDNKQINYESMNWIHLAQDMKVVISLRV